MRNFSSGAILKVLCILVVVLTFGYVFESVREGGNSAHAEELVSLCASSENNASCYEREVPKLLSEMPLENVFGLIREIRTLDPDYQFCHVLAHKLGERIVAEDPARWLDAISLNPPDGMCSNGFIHGVVGGRFRAEVLEDETLEEFIPDFRKACEPRPDWSPSELDRAICYHGMGHLFMFITDANVPRALDVCEEVAPEGMRRVCIEGIFMQIYQPLEPDDFELLKRLPIIPDATTYRTFCTRFKDDEQAGACLREAWPLFRDGIISGSGVSMFCADQPNSAEESKCYETTSSIIGRMTLERPQDAARACSLIPESHRAQCFEAVARAILEEDRDAAEKAVALCEKAGGTTGSRTCLERLIQTSRFMFGSNRSHYSRLCAAMPDGLEASCREKSSRFITEYSF